jgi:class 3 adenylate cyclase
MSQEIGEELLRYLIGLTSEIAQGRYDQSTEVFEFTKTGQYPELISELAESFGMMMVKVETREYQLEQMIEELRRKNLELETTLRKVELLENIKGHLGKFVPESVKRLIETAPDAPDLEKRERDVSVLFLDIAGYTRLSERVDSEKVNYLVERYFSSFLDDIYQNKGDINETAGDGLMILFQDEEGQQHALNAVRTAVAIRAKVGMINLDLVGRFEPIRVNIGINSGNALVGSSRFEGLAGTRWTFTASGSVTNVAARIGKLATEGEILVGEETAKRIQGRFPVAGRGAQTLKNVSEPVVVYQVLAEEQGDLV